MEFPMRLFLSLVAFALAFGSRLTAAEKPNIVVILVDDRPLGVLSQKVDDCPRWRGSDGFDFPAIEDLTPVMSTPRDAEVRVNDLISEQFEASVEEGACRRYLVLDPGHPWLVREQPNPSG